MGCEAYKRRLAVLQQEFRLKTTFKSFITKVLEYKAARN